ncbi:uncharacterized protein LOC108916877 [Anoplophora glabripennis]|uniref:uncharacterized protein LOC108916877 n=1 Tax=Anoplophora glabripennis TaxID=217634 RepID=UPI00087590D9|nr:uncharacterized protein LOC108916877 [Anoplophora glabripennis]
MPSKTIENIPKLDNNLEPHQDEFQQLGELAGIYMDHKVFRILIELLNMGIDPDTIYNLLKTIKRSRNPKSRSSVTSQKSSSRSKN